MKFLNTTMKKMKAALKDESGQGATEYILLLVIVVGIAVVFGPEIKGAIQKKLNDFKTGFDSVKG